MRCLSIKALHAMLLQLSVEHIYKPLVNGYQIIIDNHNARVYIVEYFGLYGNEEDNLEVWNFTSEPPVIELNRYMGIHECLDFLDKKGFLAKL